MENLSLVTAKITRENEQYNYRIVGRGEKYLVKHADGENAGDKVLEYLTPFAKEPVVIQQVTLQKNTEIVGDGDRVFKSAVEFIEVNEATGKEKKTRHNYFVCADSIKEAFSTLEQYFSDLSGYVSANAITLVARTNIIEIIE